MASTLSMFETVLRRCCPVSRWKASFHTPATRSALLYSSQSRIGNTSKANALSRTDGVFLLPPPPAGRAFLLKKAGGRPCLRALGFAPRMVDVLDSEVEFVSCCSDFNCVPAQI